MTLTCQRTNAKGAVCGGAFDAGICERCGRPEQTGTLVSAVTGTATAFAPGADTAPRDTGTAGTGSTSGHTGRRSSRRQTRGSTSRRQSLGGGLVSLPPMPSQDPLHLVLDNPEVSLGKRRCPQCTARVNRVKGFCPECSAPYDFEPKLKAGAMVASKYEIKGPIAFGGMGWVYLGWDLVLSRWVVLKGLLNANDKEALDAALAERQFLAAVKHGRIVGIYDFVQQGTEGFMVLEYVGGRTIESLRDERGPLPPEEAIAYILGILPAFAYLHAQGYVYCDFKPGNLMLEGDDVKLIDMGAVRRIGDPDGAVFGTDGYAAADASDDPTVVSDLYTVGRTLAVLMMDFLYRTTTETDPTTGKVTTSRRMLKTYVASLPAQEDQAVLRDHDSLYRFLLRATHADPDQRFQSADEMEAQLFGVLRQIMAAKTGPKPAESKSFFGDGLINGGDRAGASAPLARVLPTLRIDPEDPAAADLVGLAALTDPRGRIEALRTLRSKRPTSVEIPLREADALIAVGDFSTAHGLMAEMLQDNAFEWRAHWIEGKAFLAEGKPKEARLAFGKVYAEMPGELAPILAMAFAAEAEGQPEKARPSYRRVMTTDPGYASACFGRARVEAACGDPPQAEAALEAVPASSSLFTEARLQLAARLLKTLSVEAAAAPGRQPGKPWGSTSGGAIVTDVLRVHGVIQSIHGQNGERDELAGRFLATTAMLLASGKAVEADTALLGAPMKVRSLRLASEKAYRDASRMAPTAAEKARLVDLANAVRPGTLV